MYLASKDRKTWVMSDQKSYYSSEYIEPVSGIFIPALGSYYQDTLIVRGLINYIRLGYLDSLDNWYLLDRNRQFIHFAMGPVAGKAICNQVKMKKIDILPGDMYICMECQYEFWREENG